MRGISRWIRRAYLQTAEAVGVALSVGMAGRAIAAQGFNENVRVLAMLAIYGALVVTSGPVVQLLCGFGLLISAAMAALWWRERRRCGSWFH